MTDHKLEWLKSVMDKQAATEQLLTGARMIAVGGERGIQEAAQSNPELLLAAILGLAKIVEVQQQTFLSMVEERLELMDQIDKLRS